jgi:putative membrane protein
VQSLETESSRPVGRRPQPVNPAAVDDPRVYLAAERTFLAWVRTSVALMGFGFLIARFAFWLRDDTGLQAPRLGHRLSAQISPWLGFGMVIVGVLVLVVAAIRHRDYIHALEEGVKNPTLGLGTSLAIAAILALVGLAMSVQILLF